VFSVALLAQICPATAATFTVTNVSDAGPGTLRQAIIDANSLPDADTIEFNIDGTGPHTIAPTSELPKITEPLTIDGYSQIPASLNTQVNGNNAVIQIRLSGTNAGGGTIGLRYDSAGCAVRGLAIVGFAKEGILLDGSSDTVIQGNFIGLDVDGVTLGGNGGPGIHTTADGAMIGGMDPGDRNLISGNGDVGIEIKNSAINMVQGNFIGTDRTGTLARGNRLHGIAVLNAGSSLNLIGGVSINERNLISGNGSGFITNHAIYIQNADMNTVQGNFIGTDVSGAVALPNSGSGVYLTVANGNVIGSSTAGAGNVIAFNADAGVRLDSGTNNPVLGNSIFSNGGLGIDLGNDGVTSNDGGDADTGANERQNYPVVTAATNLGGRIIIEGTFDSQADTEYVLEFFTSPECDPFGFGEGKTYLDSTIVITDGSGFASFSLDLPTADSFIKVVTATARDQNNNNTSEFSACHPVEDVRPASITAQPQSQIVADGKSATLSVTATGGAPLIYRWFLDGAIVTDATNSALVLTNVQAANAGAYSVVVSNAFGSVTSAMPAVLTVMGAIADQTAYVLQRLLATNVISDPGQAANRWTFHLDAGAPTGARISTNKGLFFWVPARNQAPSTNTISIIATDNSVPAVTGTNTFKVVVTDYLELMLSHTELRAGTTGSVQVSVFASAGVTNLNFILEAPETRLTNLWVESLQPAVAPGSLLPAGADRSAVTFETLGSQFLVGSQPLARLHFLATTNHRSDFVALVPTSVTTTQTNGVMMPRLLIHTGRAAVIEDESLLEILPDATNTHILILYGKMGTNYAVSTTGNLVEPITWTPAWSVTLTNLFHKFDGLTNTGGARFYRANEQ
jgi:hypothetical protein